MQNEKPIYGYIHEVKAQASHIEEDAPCSAKFELTVGFLLRNKVKYELEKMGVEYDIEVEIVEDKGWVSSTFYIKLKASKRLLIAAVEAINDFLQRAKNSQISKKQEVFLFTC